MSDEIGYPTTTNRSGSWNPTPEEQDAAAIARRKMDPNQHLDQILAPIKERGIQSVDLLGLDTMAEKLGDLVNLQQDDGRENFKKLTLAIGKAIDASRIAHPHMIGQDPSDHQISQAETKRRIHWCITIAQQMRFDMKWSLTRICEKLPLLLDHWLEGTFEQHLHERRGFFARGKTPAGLKRAMAKGV